MLLTMELAVPVTARTPEKQASSSLSLSSSMLFLSYPLPSAPHCWNLLLTFLVCLIQLNDIFLHTLIEGIGKTIFMPLPLHV